MKLNAPSWSNWRFRQCKKYKTRKECQQEKERYAQDVACGNSLCVNAPEVTGETSFRHEKVCFTDNQGNCATCPVGYTPFQYYYGRKLNNKHYKSLAAYKKPHEYMGVTFHNALRCRKTSYMLDKATSYGRTLQEISGGTSELSRCSPINAGALATQTNYQCVVGSIRVAHYLTSDAPGQSTDAAGCRQWFVFCPFFKQVSCKQHRLCGGNRCKFTAEAWGLRKCERKQIRKKKLCRTERGKRGRRGRRERRKCESREAKARNLCTQERQALEEVYANANTVQRCRVRKLVDFGKAECRDSNGDTRKRNTWTRVEDIPVKEIQMLNDPANGKGICVSVASIG